MVRLDFIPTQIWEASIRKLSRDRVPKGFRLDSECSRKFLEADGEASCCRIYIIKDPYEYGNPCSYKSSIASISSRAVRSISDAQELLIMVDNEVEEVLSRILPRLPEPPAFKPEGWRFLSRSRRCCA